MTAVDALRRVAAIGPYFAVDLDPRGPGWLPLRVLLDDPDAVRERVAFVRGALALRAGRSPGDIDARAAASIHFLGLAARLAAPALAAAAVTGVVPEIAADHLRWQRTDGGPVPVAVTSVSGAAVGSPAEAAERLLAGPVAELVTPAVAAFGAAGGVSPIVLWGNVASALAGAAGMLRGADQPLLLDPVQVVAEMLASPGPLEEAGRFDVAGRYFVRASCCLFYRVPDAGKCGDCVLV